MTRAQKRILAMMADGWEKDKYAWRLRKGDYFRQSREAPFIALQYDGYLLSEFYLSPKGRKLGKKLGPMMFRPLRPGESSDSTTT